MDRPATVSVLALLSAAAIVQASVTSGSSHGPPRRLGPETFADLGVSAEGAAPSRAGDGRWLPFRPHGFKRRFGLPKEFARRKGTVDPPFGSIVKVYLGGPPQDGSNPASASGPVLLKQSSSSGLVSYPGLAVATNDPNPPETMPSMLIARRRGRPATSAPLAGGKRRRPFGRRQGGRRKQPWFRPGAAVERRGGLAPVGHWEGVESRLGWREAARADRQVAPSEGKTDAKSSRGSAKPRTSGRTSLKPGRMSSKPSKATKSSTRTEVPPTKRAPARSKSTSRSKSTQPKTVPKTTTSTRRPPPSRGQQHKNVDLTASVLYPGARKKRPVATVAKDGVIVAVGADPETAAGQLTAGRGFRLRPQTVQYGGWKPIAA